MEFFEDEQLVINYQSGDERALSQLIERYAKHIFNFCLRYAGNVHDAQDIVQDTFVKVWKSISRFDTQKSFKVWLYVIAKNTSLDWLKKKRPELLSTFETNEGLNPVLDTLSDDELLPDEIAVVAEQREEMAKAIDQLPELYRSVIALRYSGELSFEEIAEVLQKPLETVRSQHRRALAKLKDIFINHAPLSGH